MKKTEKFKCDVCGKEYELFMFNNFNLDLCPECFEKEEKLIERDEFVDNITHVVTCPLCGKVYGMEIVDEKCETKNCPVHFFWNELDCNVFARWRKK